MTGPDTTPIPTTWPEVMDEYADFSEEALQRVAAVAGVLAERDDESLIASFVSTDLVLARGLVLLGLPACRPALDGWVVALPRAVEAMRRIDMSGRLGAHYVLSFGIVAESAGYPREGSLGPLVFRALQRAPAESFSEIERRSFAFSALAIGETRAAYAFLGAGAAEGARPGQTFQFNLFELARYLGRALDDELPRDWVDPAWLEYLALFPGHLAAGAASWPELVSVACVVAKLGGEPIGMVAEDLHARVLSYVSDRR